MLLQMQKALDELISAVPLADWSYYRFHCRMGNSFNFDANDKTCQTFYLGSLIQALNAKGLYPLPTSMTYNGSLTDCRTCLIECLSHIKPPSATFGHIKCSPEDAIKGKLLAVTANIPLTEAQEKHLSRQALRSGLVVQI